MRPDRLLRNLNLALSNVEDCRNVNFLCFTYSNAIPRVFGVVSNSTGYRTTRLFVRLLRFATRLPRRRNTFYANRRTFLASFFGSLVWCAMNFNGFDYHFRVRIIRARNDGDSFEVSSSNGI